MEDGRNEVQDYSRIDINMKKVCFRADASSQIGYGHFIRSLALAEILKNSFDCCFYTQEPDQFQIDEMNKVCSWKGLPSNETKYDIFLSELDGTEIVVLDNYFFSSYYEKAIKDKGCKVVAIGTNNRHYYADVIVNFTKIQPKDFSSENYTRFCLGLDWTIMRSPFYHIPIGNSRDKITICIGGTDQYGYSEKFYNSITKHNPETDIIIISTDRIGQERIDAMRHNNINIKLNLSANEMANIFACSIISIVSASSVAFEALSQGSNVIAGYYVANQIDLYNALAQDGYIWAVDDFATDQSIHKINDAIEKIVNGNKKQTFKVNKIRSNYVCLFKSL